MRVGEGDWEVNNEKYVYQLTDEACREELIYIRTKLDELDEDDALGTEGWKHTLGIDE